MIIPFTQYHRLNTSTHRANITSLGQRRSVRQAFRRHAQNVSQPVLPSEVHRLFWTLDHKTQNLRPDLWVIEKFLPLHLTKDIQTQKVLTYLLPPNDYDLGLIYQDGPHCYSVRLTPDVNSMAYLPEDTSSDMRSTNDMYMLHSSPFVQEWFSNLGQSILTTVFCTMKVQNATQTYAHYCFHDRTKLAACQGLQPEVEHNPYKPSYTDFPLSRYWYHYSHVKTESASWSFEV